MLCKHIILCVSRIQSRVEQLNLHLCYLFIGNASTSIATATKCAFPKQFDKVLSVLVINLAEICHNLLEDGSSWPMAMAPSKSSIIIFKN